jgi:tryptophanyl-tRNA synthetase
MDQSRSPRPTSASTTHARLPRVFSGVQPTGTLHLGTYVGALRQWVARQDERENIFCVVDLHALTIPEVVDPRNLRAASRAVAALFFASGIDPERNIVFVQSHLPEHAELAWILNCTTPLGWLQRMTQFKSKAETTASIGTGLLGYPVLQAADILLYDTDYVPVGEDQRQHVELTRDIATRFNNLFGEVFTLPEVVVPDFGAKIMGLDDPTVKMSKSLTEGRGGHAINLLDPEKVVRKTIMSAVTDSGREFRFEHASAGVLNLLTIYRALTGISAKEVEAQFEGAGYGKLKTAVAGVVLDALAPIQETYRLYMDDQSGLDGVLQRGAERAQEVAGPVLDRVKEAVGVG